MIAIFLLLFFILSTSCSSGANPMFCCRSGHMVQEWWMRIIFRTSAVSIWKEVLFFPKTSLGITSTFCWGHYLPPDVKILPDADNGKGNKVVFIL